MPVFNTTVRSARRRSSTENQKVVALEFTSSGAPDTTPCFA
jgi:hypothetical protein